MPPQAIKLLICFHILLGARFASAQKADSSARPIQFSGLVIDAKNNEPMSFATILIKNRMRGTVTDQRGYFSFVALIGDTIRFSSLGYKKSFFVIPDTISGQAFSIIQPLERDTLTLKPVRVWPWANKEQFSQEFLAAELPDEKEEIARKNLEAEMMAELSYNMKMDGSENQRAFIQNEIQKTYFSGGQANYMNMGGPNGVPIPSSMLNPLNWASFFKALKRGDFTKKYRKPKTDDE